MSTGSAPSHFTFQLSHFRCRQASDFRFQISIHHYLLQYIRSAPDKYSSTYSSNCCESATLRFQISKPHFSLVLKCVLISEVNFSFQASTEIKLRVLNCEGSDFKFQASMEARSEIRSIRLQTSNFTLQLKCACRMWYILRFQVQASSFKPQLKWENTRVRFQDFTLLISSYYWN